MPLLGHTPTIIHVYNLLNISCYEMFTGHYEDEIFFNKKGVCRGYTKVFIKYNDIYLDFEWVCKRMSNI